MTTQSGPSRQEDITLNAPAPGHYTVRVDARAGAGDFVGDVSAALAPADTARAGADARGSAGGHERRHAGAAGRRRRRRSATSPRSSRACCATGTSCGGSAPRRCSASGRSTDLAAARAGRLHGRGRAGRQRRQRHPPLARRSRSTRPRRRAPVIEPIGAAAEQPHREPVGDGGAGREDVDLRGREQARRGDRGGGGAWAHALQQVADGTHTYTVTATDAAGNVSAPASVTVRVDTDARRRPRSTVGAARR